jgi:hypothetical protein
MRQGYVVTFSEPGCGNGFQWVTVPGSAFTRATLMSGPRAEALASRSEGGRAVYVTEVTWPGVMGWVYRVTDPETGDAVAS